MNPLIKQQWIDALRSGEYKQGIGALRDGDNKFCCLGVLCDLHAKKTRGAAWSSSPFYKLGIRSRTRYSYGPFQQVNVPPGRVTDWAGISNKDKTIGHLMDMNDRDHKTFKEIADYIERNL